ncbi:ALQxL family class IV lanthipeptide [Kitasatospora sp. NPDC058965]
MTIDVDALQLLESDEATAANACGIFTFFDCPMFTSTEATQG